MVEESVRGVIIAVLRERHVDRLVVANATVLYLRPGDACAHTPGTTLRIDYTIEDGRYQVDHIEAEPPAG